MDGFYPYQEMDTYLGVLAIGLAIVGAAAYRDRWVAFWVLLAGIGGVLMLGRYTFLLDLMHRVPIVGSSRIPVRFHLWVALATSALAAVGVDRLARPGAVRLRGAVATAALLVVGVDPDPGLRLRAGLDRAEAVDAARTTSTATAGSAASWPSPRSGRRRSPAWAGSSPRWRRARHPTRTVAVWPRSCRCW